MVLPLEERWGTLLSPGEGPGEFHGKFPIYVTSTEEPTIRATLESEEPVTVDGTTSPTASGIPGGLPAGLVFSETGCWVVTVEGKDGTVSFKVDVR